MNTLHTITEYFTNGYKIELLDIFSIIAILCGILVIISKNPILSVLFLIGLFLSIAGYLMTLGLNFIGLSYLLVYVGAVSILFLFILMLINVRISELLSNTSNSVPLAILISLSFNFPVNQILPESSIVLNDKDNSYNPFIIIYREIDNGIISFVTSKVWDANLSETSHITSIGNIMYTSHSVWLILTSIILLLAMVGAIVITIKQEN